MSYRNCLEKPILDKGDQCTKSLWKTNLVWTFGNVEAIASGTEQVDLHFKPSVKQSSLSTRQIQTSIKEMMDSLKDHYTAIKSTTTWGSILEQWRDHLNVLTGHKNFTECSEMEDCLDHFFRNLDEFYPFEYSNRALEIKQMKTIFSLLQRDSSFSTVKGILSNARALLIKTQRLSVLRNQSSHYKKLA